MLIDVQGINSHGDSRSNGSSSRGATADAPFADILARVAESQAAMQEDHAAASGVAHDFRNMTPRELQNVVNGLIRDGQLTLDETSPLLLLMWPPSVALNPAGDVEGLLDKPRDFIAELETSIQWALERNEPDSAAFRQMALTALQRFQSPDA